MTARRVLALALLACLAYAAPASAFTPPELFVRLQRADITHEQASDWIPLASAPQLNYLGGYQIGYRLQDSGVANNFQRAALTVTGVPDGQATQPHNATPYCVGEAGTAGTIVPVGSELQFEGDGTYTVAVSLGPGSGGPSDCLAGPTTSGSFTVDVHAAPMLVGAPLAVRTTPLPGNPFVGVRGTPEPPGGVVETRCALNATIQPDGSVAGPLLVPDDAPSSGPILEGAFARPGAWACVSRGASVGVDDNFDTTTFGTPWSAPLRFDVRADFRRAKGRITGRRAAHPLFTFTAEFLDAASGGKATLKLRRLARCRGKRYVFKTVGTYRGVFDAKGRAKVRIRRQRKVAYYLGVLRFAGTRFYRASTDPNGVLLQVPFKGGIELVDPRDYPRCPGGV
jgi:hypothetical protein